LPVSLPLLFGRDDDNDDNQKSSTSQQKRPNQVAREKTLDTYFLAMVI